MRKKMKNFLKESLIGALSCASLLAISTSIKPYSHNELNNKALTTINAKTISNKDKDNQIIANLKQWRATLKGDYGKRIDNDSAGKYTSYRDNFDKYISPDEVNAINNIKRNDVAYFQNHFMSPNTHAINRKWNSQQYYKGHKAKQSQQYYRLEWAYKDAGYLIKDIRSNGWTLQKGKNGSAEPLEPSTTCDPSSSNLSKTQRKLMRRLNRDTTRFYDDVYWNRSNTPNHPNTDSDKVESRHNFKFTNRDRKDIQDEIRVMQSVQALGEMPQGWPIEHYEPFKTGKSGESSDELEAFYAYDDGIDLMNDICDRNWGDIKASGVTPLDNTKVVCSPTSSELTPQQQKEMKQLQATTKQLKKEIGKTRDKPNSVKKRNKRHKFHFSNADDTNIGHEIHIMQEIQSEGKKSKGWTLEHFHPYHASKYEESSDEKEADIAYDEALDVENDICEYGWGDKNSHNKPKPTPSKCGKNGEQYDGSKSSTQSKMLTNTLEKYKVPNKATGNPGSGNPKETPMSLKMLNNDPDKSINSPAPKGTIMMVNGEAKKAKIYESPDGNAITTVGHFKEFHIPNINNVSDTELKGAHIYVFYPNAIQYSDTHGKNQQTYDMLMDIDLGHSIRSPYKDDHNVKIADSFDRGVVYDGMERLQVDYTAFHKNQMPNSHTSRSQLQHLVNTIEGNGNTKGNGIPLTGSWVSADSLNPVTVGTHYPKRSINDIPMPGEDVPNHNNIINDIDDQGSQGHHLNINGYNKGAYGEWVNYNGYQKGHHTDPMGYTLHDPGTKDIGTFNNIEQGLLNSTESYNGTADAGVNGGLPNRPFIDGWLAQYAEHYLEDNNVTLNDVNNGNSSNDSSKYNWAKEIVRDFEKNSIFFQLGGDQSNIFDFGSGRDTTNLGNNQWCEGLGNHGAWFKISTFMQPPSVDHLKCHLVKNNHNKYVPQITDNGKVIKDTGNSDRNKNPILNVEGLSASLIDASSSAEAKNYLDDDGRFQSEDAVQRWEKNVVACYVPPKPSKVSKYITGLHKASGPYSNEYGLDSNYQKFNYNIKGQIPAVNKHSEQDWFTYRIKQYHTQSYPYTYSYNTYINGYKQTVTKTSQNDQLIRDHDKVVGPVGYHTDQHDTYTIYDKMPKEIIAQDPTHKVSIYTKSHGNIQKVTNISPTIDYNPQVDNVLRITLHYKDMEKLSNKRIIVKIPSRAELKGSSSAQTLASNNGGKGLIYTMDNGNKGEHAKNTDGNTEAYVRSKVYSGPINLGYGKPNSDDYKKESAYYNNPNVSYTHHTNLVRTIIPVVEVRIHKYNWDNSSNSQHEIFPSSQQPFGGGDCESIGNLPSPQSKQNNYKQYLYKKYYNSNSTTDITPSDDKFKFEFVNHVFNESDKVNGSGYHSIYPMGNTPYQELDLYGKDSNAISTFDNDEEKLNANKNEGQVRGFSASGSHYIPINTTPTKSSDDSDGPDCNIQPTWDWYHSDISSQPTQDVYIPYIQPKVDIACMPGSSDCPVQPPYKHNLPRNPRNKLRFNNDESARLVIDTDKKQHGLPFHLVTSSFNVMYDDGAQHFDDDFDGVTVTLTIRDKNNNTILYQQSRPLGSMINNSSQKFHDNNDNNATDTASNPYRWSHPEYPEGNTDWKGYIDAYALQKNNLNGDSQYALNTSGDPDASKKGFPVSATFTFSSSNMPHKTIETHAYIASRPKIKRDEFGLKHKTRYGEGTSTNIINGNDALFVEPERTEAYGAYQTGDDPQVDDGHSESGEKGSDGNYINKDDNTYVRDLDEALYYHQPQKQEAKAGYGLRANDIKLVYIGHLNALEDAKQGTGLITAYPKEFNYKDSNISDNNDSFNHKKSYSTTSAKDKQNFSSTNGQSSLSNGAQSLLATPMIHENSSNYALNNTDGDSQDNDGNTNNPHSASQLTNGLNLNDSDLDSSSNNKDIELIDFLDNSFDNANDGRDGDLDTERINTSYGYLPKAMSTQNSKRSGIASVSMNGFKGAIDNAFLNSSDAKNPASHESESINSTPHKVNNNTGYSLLSNNGKHVSSTNNKSISHNMVMNNAQGNRLFLQQFLHTGIYPMYFESNFYNGPSTSEHEYNTRLGGNFFRIINADPLQVYAHMYVTRNDSSVGQAFDELSPQPIVTDTKSRKDNNGTFNLQQVPTEFPAIGNLKSLWLFNSNMWSNDLI